MILLAALYKRFTFSSCCGRSGTLRITLYSGKDSDEGWSALPGLVSGRESLELGEDDEEDKDAFNAESLELSRNRGTQ